MSVIWRANRQNQRPPSAELAKRCSKRCP